jgi:hypothetical protein
MASAYKSDSSGQLDVECASVSDGRRRLGSSHTRCGVSLRAILATDASPQLAYKIVTVMLASRPDR